MVNQSHVWSHTPTATWEGDKKKSSVPHSSLPGASDGFCWFLLREKKKELEREELWKKLEELKLKKALEKQNSAYSVHGLLGCNTGAK